MPLRSQQRLPTTVTASIGGPQRAVPGSTPGRPGWLAKRASSPRYVGGNKVEHTAEIRAVCQVPEDKMTENHSDCLVLPCTTLGEVRGGSNAARRQIMQIPAGFARTPQTLEPSRFPSRPGYPGYCLRSP